MLNDALARGPFDPNADRDLPTKQVNLLLLPSDTTPLAKMRAQWEFLEPFVTAVDTMLRTLRPFATQCGQPLDVKNPWDVIAALGLPEQPEELKLQPLDPNAPFTLDNLRYAWKSETIVNPDARAHVLTIIDDRSGSKTFGRRIKISDAARMLGMGSRYQTFVGRLRLAFNRAHRPEEMGWKGQFKFSEVEEMTAMFAAADKARADRMKV